MDRESLIELFAAFGPVTVSRMFSGHGISAGGTTFALALRGEIFLRADDSTVPDFAAEGLHPFSYQTRLRQVTVRSYWQLPARLYDDPVELAEWSKRALAVAERAAMAKRSRKPRTSDKSKKPAKPVKTR